MEKTICVECGAINDYELRNCVRKYEGEGYNFSLNVKIPFCRKCGAPVTNEEIEKEINEIANNKIRESRGIIKKEEITDILSKYNVSQKFLSKLLGWGEITLTRYISGGYTPNSSNSDKLKALYDPYVFQKLLNEKKKDDEFKVKNEASIKKLQVSINKNISEVEKRKGKIFEVINWFLSQSTKENPVTHLALQKLLYFSQGWNRIWNQEWLFENDCEAWVHGAVFRSVYDEFKKFEYNPLPEVELETRLSTDEVNVLEFVKKYYFDVYTAKSLEVICHLEEPYKLARCGYKDSEKSRNIIEKKNIFEYYSKIAVQYNISNQSTSSIKNYLNDLMS